MDDMAQATMTRPWGVSVITCTNRPQFVHQAIENFKRQTYPHKELILILNIDKVDMHHYDEIKRQNPNVTIYQLPAKKTLGSCLNYGVDKANYSIIAKMDDDDFYGTYYLNSIMRTFLKKKVDIIGKHSCLLYLKRNRELWLLNPGNEHTFVDRVMGGTIAFRRRLFQKVQFRNVSVGEDIGFFQDAAAHKFTIYSIDRHNYVYIRRANPKSHTWVVEDRNLVPMSKFLGKNKAYRIIATRKVE